MTDNQKSKLAFAIKKRCPLTVRLKHSNLDGNDDLLLIKRQVNKMEKSIANGTGTDINLSKTQISISWNKIASLCCSVGSQGT